MSSGPPSAGNNLTSSVSGLGTGLMRLTACENCSVNHTALGANGRSIPVGEVSISVLDFSNKARCPGKYCPNKSGSYPLPPGIVVPLE
jgi:hypothetical protein